MPGAEVTDGFILIQLMPQQSITTIHQQLIKIQMQNVQLLSLIMTYSCLMAVESLKLQLMYLTQ